MKTVRLKGIIPNCDFRKNEATNYDIYKKSRKFQGKLKKNEVYLFISRSGNQLFWLLNVGELEVEHANKRGSYERRLFDTRDKQVHLVLESHSQRKEAAIPRHSSTH